MVRVMPNNDETKKVNDHEAHECESDTKTEDFTVSTNGPLNRMSENDENS